MGAEDVAVSVCICAFDCLLLNGEPHVHDLLSVHGELCFAHHVAHHKYTENTEEIAEHLIHALLCVVLHTLGRNGRLRNRY